MGASLREYIGYHGRRAHEEHARAGRAHSVHVGYIHDTLALLHEARRADLLSLVPFERDADSH